MKIISRKRKNLKKSSEDNLKEGTKIWAEFYRKNPHRLVTEYLGLKLYMFQNILLYMMNTNLYFVFIASRGLGKSYLTALFCVVRCILYPETMVLLSAGSKKQAGMIITQKIEMMRRQSVVLNAEIDDIRSTSDEISCTFKNGSVIQAIVSGDNGRGFRGNILIVDEYRIKKKDEVDSVLKPMLTAPRKPRFRFKPEYEHYPEEPNKELYLSSAWYKGEWSYDKFKETLKSMLDGKSHFCCDIPYLCSLDNGLVLKEKLEEDRRSIGKIKFDMEYCGKPIATVYRNIHYIIG